MPICEVGKYQNDEDAAKNKGIKIFYRTYGQGPAKVLMIIGLAGTHDSWIPQIKELAGTVYPNDYESPSGDMSSGDDGGDGNIEVCAFDNRGMGLSSVPMKKYQYTTRIMAKDAIALMDHLGWEKAHIFGHSMGGMIACKLAALVPNRVLSLALLNVTGGGFQCIPKFDRRTLSIAVRFLKAKTPEQRAAVDLDTHYSKEFLEEYVGANTRRAILYQEYVKAISATGMQSSYGLDGMMSLPNYAMHRTLAEKLYPFARMVELHGGHLVSHERTEEVNEALLQLIKASESKINALEWTNLTKETTGWKRTPLSIARPDGLSFVSYIIERLQVFLLYIFGLFLLAFEHTIKSF